MEQNIEEKYKLSEKEHQEIYQEIENEVFGRTTTEKQPIGIIAGGQPGSGKGALISFSKNEVENKGKDIIIISTDDYKPYHPKSIEIAKKYPTEYVKIVEQDAGKWTGKILEKAIKERYNFIFEGTLKNDRILERIKEMRQNGFNIIVRVLAVPKLESLISIHERYQHQIENMGWGRLISIDHHNKAYMGIPSVIDKIEKSGLCDVEIFTRGEEISKTKKIYSSKQKNEIYPTARIAMEEYRKLEQGKVMLTANERVEKLKEKFIARGASKEEMEQIEQLESYITKDKIK